MITFITANMGTILVLVVLCTIVGLIIRSMIRDHKAGRFCGGKCAGCASCAGCGGGGCGGCASHKV